MALECYRRSLDTFPRNISQSKSMQLLTYTLGHQRPRYLRNKEDRNNNCHIFLHSAKQLSGKSVHLLQICYRPLHYVPVCLKLYRVMPILEIVYTPCYYITSRNLRSTSFE